MWHCNLIILLLLIIQFCFAQEQAVNTFPNPRTNGYSDCGLKSKGYVCDPDKQFTEQERYRLNNDLLQLSQRTSGDQRADFCTTKGVDATLFITKQGNKQLAHQLNIFWAVDEQCKKSIVFVLSTNDHSLYYAADENSPICFFKKIIKEQQKLLNEGKFTRALTTIFTNLGESIQNNKQSNKKKIEMNDDMHRGGTSKSITQISILLYFMIISSIALYLLAV
uniref:TPM domain-containing protein n=1 Tax=Wuchereria bancrofti TaxID=6293 RepID=A0A1I8ELE8_WUCBA